MSARLVLGYLVLATMLECGPSARAQDAVATPAIDASIFKDGEVAGRAFNTGSWYAKCQQIVKIKRVVCNLLTNLNDRDGQVSGSVLIATTDVGIPAMLISISRAITDSKKIQVASTHVGKVDGKLVKVEFSQIVNPMVCNETCKYMFPLDPKLVFILNAGEVVQIYIPPKDGVDQGTNKKKQNKQSVEYRVMSIPGRGFAEVLTESTKPW